MNAVWARSHASLHPFPNRTGLRIIRNQTKCLRQSMRILLSLLKTEQPDSFAVDFGDIRLCLPREIDVHDWAAFQASFITSSIDFPENPLA